MYILRIEHPISGFEGWKKAFDSDPVSREKSGVRRYQILRPLDNANYVMIDLEFDTVSQAEALLAARRVAWSRVQGKIIMNPQARLVEAVETREYRGENPFCFSTHTQQSTPHEQSRDSRLPISRSCVCPRRR